MIRIRSKRRLGTSNPSDPAPVGRLAVARRASLTTGDQVLSSISNFAVGVAAARIAGASGLGVFSIAYACWLLVAAAHRSLVTDPMVIEGDARHPNSVGAVAGLAAELVIGCVAMAVVAVLGATLLALGQSSFADALLGLAPWLPCLIIQDYWRWVGFMQAAPGKALANDALFICVQALSLAVVVAAGSHSPAAIIGSWGMGGVAGAAFGLRQFRMVPRLGGGMDFLRKRWGVGKWLGVNTLTSWGTSQANVFFVGGLLGPATLGGLKAAQTLVQGPSFVLIQAGGSIGLPEASRALADRGPAGLRRVTAIVTAAGLATVGLYGVTVAVCAHPLLQFVYGKQFGQYVLVVDILAAAYVIQAIGLGSILVLKATRRTKRLFLAETLALGVSLVTMPWLTVKYGIEGTAIATLCTSATFSTGIMYFGHRAMVAESAWLARSPAPAMADS